jgi:agmatinase
MPFDQDESEIVIYPVPWEVTVSYAAGTAAGPEAIAQASYQVDLYDPAVQDAWKMGIYMAQPHPALAETSEVLREEAVRHIDALAAGDVDAARLQRINAGCAYMVETVKKETGALLDAGKAVCLLGGDHSTPLGFVQALAERHDAFGVLQIDAHADLRNAFEQFTYSHASITYNMLKVPQVAKVVQVGIRDYCDEEIQVMENQAERVKVFFDRDIKHAQFEGATWAQQVAEIVAALPMKVYVSFDIDGLDPKLCPNTGTPVAGGFEVEQILYLLEKVLESGRILIGADLNEVAPGTDEWDANVGARLLYRICNLLGQSNKIHK